jgi:transposase
MNRSHVFFVGIDCAADSLAVALGDATVGKGLTIIAEKSFDNSAEGFELMHRWLSDNAAVLRSTLVCVENTGVYSEHVCYWLNSRQYDVWLVSPQKTSRAASSRDKTDQIDARQIAEYAWRYYDKLELFEPNHEIVEQVRVLLAAREQLVAEKTANSSTLKAVKRKYVQTPKALSVFERHLAQLGEHIDELEAEIKRLINSDPAFKATAALLMSIPTVKLLMAANLLVLTQGFTRRLDPRTMAAFVGISPHQHTSGTSVRHKARSAGFGPPRIRKLLYLAAMSLKTHRSEFKAYFQRKRAEGKEKPLILNNIANRLLRIICAVLRTETPYLKNYRSTNPALKAV